MNRYYEKLINIEGAERLRELVDKWETLSANLERFPAKAPILLPDLFVVSESDYTTSRFVDALGDYLIAKKNLMEFYGDVPSFEFMLNYHKPGSEFSEIRRLNDEVSNSAGFRTFFRGIVHIKIDAWLGHQEEQHFIEFLDYLRENTSDWLIVLSVNEKDGQKVSSMESILSMFLRIEKIAMKTASTEALVEEVEALLALYDFRLDEGARELLTGSIDVLRENRYFDSSGTIRLLGSDIIYELYSHEIRKSPVLTAEDLKYFAPESEYIRRTLYKFQKRRIGFS
ncbi:MAG: hypothetical protein Q4D81_06700 [Eubacteriales bacterium]|nr:hypothetical protein [Eubacteriales bacterium]